MSRLRPLVLGYHCVNSVANAHDPDNLVVTPVRFRWQVETLRDRGYTFVSMAEFVDRLAQSGPPAGICALTFDDGSDDPVLFDVLRVLEVPATLYVCPGLLGRPHPWLRPESRIRLMSKEALQEAARIPGLEIGSHTNLHTDLSTATAEEAYREARLLPAGSRGSPRPAGDERRLPVWSLLGRLSRGRGACRLSERCHLGWSRQLASVRATTGDDRQLGQASLVCREVASGRAFRSSPLSGCTARTARLLVRRARSRGGARDTVPLLLLLPRHDAGQQTARTTTSPAKCALGHLLSTTRRTSRSLWP